MTFNRNNEELFKNPSRAEIERAISKIDVEEWCVDLTKQLDDALTAVRQDQTNPEKMQLLRACARSSRHWGDYSKANQAATRWRDLQSKAAEIQKEFGFLE